MSSKIVIIGAGSGFGGRLSIDIMATEALRDATICLVDGTGITPCCVGELPTQLAALDRANVAVHELAVRAVLERDRESAFHACALDPLTAAVVPLDKLRVMFDELWEAEKDLLGWFDPKHHGLLQEPAAL